MIIINADDFGMSESCSKAIAEAFSKKLVTDTTVMANGEYFDKALALAEELGFIDRIGIHFNITQGKPLTDSIKEFPDFVTDGVFNKRYDLSRELSDSESEALYRELSAQVEKLEKAGVKITHADSHHYIHNAPFIAPVAERVCREHRINKIRIKRNIKEYANSETEAYKTRLRNEGFVTADYFGRLSDIEAASPEHITEIMVHPDFDRNGVLIDRVGVSDGFPFGNAFSDSAAEKTADSGGYLQI